MRLRRNVPLLGAPTFGPPKKGFNAKDGKNLCSRIGAQTHYNKLLLAPLLYSRVNRFLHLLKVTPDGN